MRPALSLSLLLFLSVGCSTGPRHPNSVRIEYLKEGNGSSSPSYKLTILGNGRVRYDGFQGVGVPGTQEYDLPRANVMALLDVLRDGYFFSMPERVPGIVFDCAVIRIRYSDEHRQKTVVDNCREDFRQDAHRHSPAEAARKGELGLWGLSREIDRLARAQRLIHPALTEYALLISEGWNVNTSGEFNWTAIDYAASRRDSTSMAFLLQHGAMASDKSLGIAATLDDQPSIRMLLGSRAISHNGVNRAAVVSARSRDTTALELMLTAGADPNGDPHSGIPIFEAVRSASGAAINILSKHGADVNARDEQGQTPLMVAATGYDSGIVTQLVRLGAQVDARDRDGKTALLRASEHCYYWTMQPLLESGADPQVIDLRKPINCGASASKVQWVTSLLKATTRQVH